MTNLPVREMLQTIERECSLTRHLTGRSAFDPRVLEAMAAVPREEFVPPEIRPCAYADNALPIGLGQTISQPFIVALMTDLLDTTSEDIILEVGTGSGYQAAILSRLVRQVYSLEIIPELAQEAEKRLKRLGCDNVTVASGNGYHGWPEHAPFDGIIVTAAASHVPPPLIEQLKPGGKLIIPVGSPNSYQQLLLLEKSAAGKILRREVLGVAFVPLTGGDNEPS
jgi:protein-L-isoaspartate(D-aspartate) O-methyltransferase